MKKLFATIVLFILCLSLSANTYIIYVDKAEQTVKGTIETVEGVEYITTTTGDRYKVNSKILVGDMDNNDVLDSDDIIQLVDAIANINTNYSILQANANRDSSQTIDSDDVVAIVDYIGNDERIWIYEVEMVVSDDWIIGTNADQAVDQA